MTDADERRRAYLEMTELVGTRWLRLFAGDTEPTLARARIEARGLSDGYNLLAWPIARAAGGVLTDLAGADLPGRPFAPDAAVDYVLAGNRALASEVASLIEAGHGAGSPG